MTLKATLQKTPVIPVLTIESLDKLANLTEALLAGGLHVLEVTLRTDCAWKAAEQLALMDNVVLGVGTVTTAEDLKQAVKIGADFIVTPGTTQSLIETALEMDAPLLPGSSSISEAMTLLEYGYTLQKFFPAEAAGGIPYLNSIRAPLPQIHFCPTGGVNPDNVKKYRQLENVITVGGSWMVPKDAIQQNDFARIEQLSRDAVNLCQN